MMRHATACLLPLLLVILLLASACGEDKTPPKDANWDLDRKAQDAPQGESDPNALDIVGSPDGDAAVDGPLPPAPLPPQGDAPQPDEPAVKGVKQVPDNLEAFHARMARLIEACKGEDDAAAEADARALLLPDPRAWFAKTFGADHPRLDALVADYEAKASQLPSLPGAIRERIEEGQEELLTERFIDPGDDLATGYQAIALRAVQDPVALYSLRLLKPDADSGWHLWSFAHVDGHFRFVGQMLALAADGAGPMVRDLGSIRVRDAKEILARRAGK